MLLHKSWTYLDTIHTCVWKFVLRAANEVYNSVLNNIDWTFLIERFPGYKNELQLKQHYIFGYPVYTLNPSLQDLKHMQHTRFVLPVLKLQSGLISSQYYVAHGDFFQHFKIPPQQKQQCRNAQLTLSKKILLSPTHLSTQK